MTTTLRIAGVQMDVQLGRPADNLSRMLDAIRDTARDGAVLTVFPECVLTGYCFESLDEALPFAEPVPGPSTERVGQLCRELDCHAVFGMLESAGSCLYNACVLVGPNGVVGVYRKIHLPFLGIDRFVTPGDQPFGVFSAGPMRIGMHICYDVSFPEAARVMALDGADLLALPTNWPTSAECAAEHVVNTRAMENHVYYLAVNRVGREGEFQFIGQSKFCGPTGKMLDQAAHDREAVLAADIDIELARNKHLVRVPGQHEIDRFADRRPEMYGRLVEATGKVESRKSRV